ncbi:hypothetical protein [Inconstantimicrobium mannanitabidum]|uniref:Uncharacterized protein n=1 Tax=Inconstantimicrobium mannanitabidum TaxID=1604901 RepID=A0ACB5RH60_9CLOT|nr:hypothetical protein [Clostridium sp. TW13]GKX68378.1 hypothetical protein rsdtw13_36360 [Clostridium sp. TW13]
MSKLKKIVGILLVYCFTMTVLPMSSLVKTVQAATNAVPKYLDYSEAYVRAGMQYKDKTLLNTNKGTLYFNNGKTSTVKNFDSYNQISDKQFFNSSTNSIFNLETGKISSLDNDNTYIKEKNLIIAKYKQYNVTTKRIIPIRSTGNIKWSVYIVGYFNKDKQYVNKMGFVSSNLSIYEVDKEQYYSLVYNSCVYKDSLYYISSGNKLIVINPDKSSYKYEFSNNLKKLYGRGYSNIYINKNGMYLKVLQSSQSGYNIALQKIKIVNNQVNPVGNKIINVSSKLPFNLISMDINNNMWIMKDGFVYKIENDVLVKKYQVNKNMNGLYVYDDKHLTVSGYDVTTKKGMYKIINIK